MKQIKQMVVGMFFLLGIGVEVPAWADSYCREYTKTVNIGGRMEEAYGQACMQPDGSWQFYNERNGQMVPMRNIVLPPSVDVVPTTRYYSNLDVFLGPVGWYPLFHNYHHGNRYYHYRNPHYYYHNQGHSYRGYDRGYGSYHHHR